jgi:hypothetical protein
MIKTAILLGLLAAAGPDKTADPRLGEQTDKICFASSINNFRPIKGEDDVVLLERGANDWYRVELMGACSYSRIRSAQSVGIRTIPGGGCLRPGDDLIFAEAFARRDAPLDYVSCRVESISRWDEKAAAPEPAPKSE